MNTFVKNLEVKAIGKNQLMELRNELDEFVITYFHVLYEGACRLSCNRCYNENNYPSVVIDYQDRKDKAGDETIFDGFNGLKMAAGHAYDSDDIIKKEQLLKTIDDLNLLLDEAAREIKCDISIKVIEK